MLWGLRAPPDGAPLRPRPDALWYIDSTRALNFDFESGYLANRFRLHIALYCLCGDLERQELTSTPVDASLGSE